MALIITSPLAYANTDYFIGETTFLKEKQTAHYASEGVRLTLESVASETATFSITYVDDSYTTLSVDYTEYVPGTISKRMIITSPGVYIMSVVWYDTSGDSYINVSVIDPYGNSTVYDLGKFHGTDLKPAVQKNLGFLDANSEIIIQVITNKYSIGYNSWTPLVNSTDGNYFYISKIESGYEIYSDDGFGYGGGGYNDILMYITKEGEKVPNFCKDDDSGLNYATQSDVSDSKTTVRDYCSDKNILVEYSCSTSFSETGISIGVRSSQHLCPNGCSNGRCAGDMNGLYWTAWLNRDEPGGDADYEHKNEFPAVCREPVSVECQTLKGLDFWETGQNVWCSREVGVVCYNVFNSEGCADYKVRFLCMSDENAQYAEDKTSCTENDSGNDIYKRGITEGVTFRGNRMQPQKLMDVCRGDHIKQYVNEYYCGPDGYVHEDFVFCPAGCVRGACTPSSAQTGLTGNVITSDKEDSDGLNIITVKEHRPRLLSVNPESIKTESVAIKKGDMHFFGKFTLKLLDVRPGEAQFVLDSSDFESGYDMPILNVVGEVLGPRIREYRIAESNGETIELIAEREMHILGIIPVKGEYTVKINTSSNELIESKQPWYHKISS